MADSGQKFIGRNRAPRVQIEYDVEIGGAEKKVEIPWVMGVMADLSGNPREALPPVAQRKSLEFDVDNFSDRMAAIKPRTTFRVENTLSEEGGEMSVDLEFSSMDDFSPAAVARKVDATRSLLEARTALSNLLSYMDGRDDAEELLQKAIQDPSLLESLAASAKPADAGDSSPEETPSE